VERRGERGGESGVCEGCGDVKTEPDFYLGRARRIGRIEAIVTKLGAVNELNPGESGEIVLDRTAIYAESGGQVADSGRSMTAPSRKFLLK